ncbi:hypothetical protein D9756_008651 [Leucocoprinus leucothites]|uniref:Uncharacterized protein n=1 Tax=Leucocoprinus leucothites TaxID=201217 RepID=A0A8H5D061_9AGAR|nr:hypothetical protein D9756_008651 [Leucoagaricus leucothites]
MDALVLAPAPLTTHALSIASTPLAIQFLSVLHLHCASSGLIVHWSLATVWRNGTAKPVQV